MSHTTSRAKHGTDRKYAQGCRCDICKSEKNRRMREYNQKRRERDGVSATTACKRRTRGVDPLASWDCFICGEPMLAAARSPRPTHKACSGGTRFKISAEARISIYERDGWTCYLCESPVDRAGDPNGDQAPSLDHVFPRAMGGGDEPDNLKTCCRLCNSLKGVKLDFALSV